MALIETLLNGQSLMHIKRSFWAVKLHDGRYISEAHKKIDLVRGVERLTDWSSDLVATGLVLDIAELWLLCPPGRVSPTGNTARLPILEPGTAFQFKRGSFDSNFALSERTMQAHIIGRVIDKENGGCECFIWDAVEQALYTPETTRRVHDDKAGGIITVHPCRTSVNDFNGWNSRTPPTLGALHHDTIGLRLG